MNIKSFGIVIVVFLIITSIISIMVPKGSIEKTIKFVISISLIFLILSSIKLIKIDTPILKYNYVEDKSEGFYSLTVNTTLELLESKIINELKLKDIILEEIKICGDILDDKSIIIDSVVYKTNCDDELPIIEKTIYENTGCKNIVREADE